MAEEGGEGRGGKGLEVGGLYYSGVCVCDVREKSRRRVVWEERGDRGRERTGVGYRGSEQRTGVLTSGLRDCRHE